MSSSLFLWQFLACHYRMGLLGYFFHDMMRRAHSDDIGEQ
jgi:hypothetical protein